MKMRSISGVRFLVKDLSKTIEFYTRLGFDFKKKEANYAAAYLNWFWIEFVPSPDRSKIKDGVSVCISVEDVDALYATLVNEDFVVSTKPEDAASGNRELSLLDPDGYRLVFFK